LVPLKEFLDNWVPLPKRGINSDYGFKGLFKGLRFGPFGLVIGWEIIWQTGKKGGL